MVEEAYMLNDKILEYFTALDNLTWYQTGGDSNLWLLILMGLIGLTGFMTILFIGGVMVKVMQLIRKEDNIKEIFTGDKRKDDVMTIWFIKRPLITFIFALVLVLSCTGVVKYINYSGGVKADLRDQKEEIILLVMDDYLGKYVGETIKPQNIFSSTEIEKNTLVKTSFKVDGVQYNNKWVYITYSSDHETDTLIPFEASSYPELIPTKEQREAPGRHDVIGDLKKGFKLKGYSQNAVYIDDVDFIYNIKIEE